MQVYFKWCAAIEDYIHWSKYLQCWLAINDSLVKKRLIINDKGEHSFPENWWSSLLKFTLQTTDKILIWQSKIQNTYMSILPTYCWQFLEGGRDTRYWNIELRWDKRVWRNGDGIGSVQKKSWFKALSASILFDGSRHNNLSIRSNAWKSFT